MVLNVMVCPAVATLIVPAPAAPVEHYWDVQKITGLTRELTLDDPKLWDHAWIYIVEPGNMKLRDEEVGILREFLLRGGTLAGEAVTMSSPPAAKPRRSGNSAVAPLFWT